MKRIVLLGLVLLSFSPIFAQKYGKTAEDSANCVLNLSLYQEFYKQKAYSDAYPAWQKVVNTCPDVTVNIYIRGVSLLKNLISTSTDPVEKEKYIQELFQVWDLRAEHFGSKGYCLGMKAKDIQTYHPKDISGALSTYLQAMTDPGAKNFYPVPFYYFQCVVSAYKAKIINSDSLFNSYDFAYSTLDKLHNQDPNNQAITKTLQGIDDLVEPYATCDKLTPILSKKFEANKTDTNFLEKATSLLNKKGCTSSDIYFKMTEALYELAPNPKSAYLMANLCYFKKDYPSVGTYLDANAAKLEGQDDRYNAYILLANSYSNLGNYAKARDEANKAIAADPKHGAPYVLIGNMYASSAQKCGDDEQVGQRAAYWAAVDKYTKAKEIEPALGSQVNLLISSYKQHFPSGDDLFFKGLKEGQSYKIGCWINETTIIRAKSK